jgi:hypothetical protein
MIISKWIAPVCFVIWSLASSVATADFLPKNDLDKEDDRSVIFNMSESEFNQIVDSTVQAFTPSVSGHNALLIANKKWDDSTVNASAMQLGPIWLINMYGGLARRPEITADAFSLVVCHEIGHHIAGFPFVAGAWASAEGESDYFATQVCPTLLWGNDDQRNAEAALTVDQTAKAKCEGVYDSQRERNLCYRTANASYGLALLLSRLKKEEAAPSFEKSDPNVVSDTATGHPKAQCRLDTYMSASLCKAQFDLRLIPGKETSQGTDSIEAEKEAAKFSCTQESGYQAGLRPACWFKARL